MATTKKPRHRFATLILVTSVTVVPLLPSRLRIEALLAITALCLLVQLCAPKPPASASSKAVSEPYPVQTPASALWLVDGSYYDLQPLMSFHPGGDRILRMSRGKDVSIAFRVHHLREQPRTRLQAYAIPISRVTGRIEASTYQYSFGSDGFYATLRERVRSHLEGAGAIAAVRQADAAYLTKVVLSSAVWAVSWWVVVCVPFFSPLAPLACVANALSRMVLTGAGHEADHGVVLPSRPVAQRLLARLGIEGFLSYDVDDWYELHMRHHLDTKTDDDPDENRGARARSFWRLSSATPWRPSHARPRLAQLLAGGLLNVAKSAERADQGRAGCALLWLHLLPLFFQPSRCAGALAVLCSSCAASYLTLLAFHVNHIQGETEHVGYAPGVDWGAHQLHTTANFDAGSKLGFFGLSGGLDLQIEHHLFPQLSYDKQRSVAPLVRATAREHGLPYHEFSSLGAGLLAHLRFMDKLGAPLSF